MSKLPDLPPLPEGAEEEDDPPESEPEGGKAPRRVTRRRRRAAPSATATENSRKGQQLRQIRDELDQAFVLLGTAISPVAQVTGAVLAARGPSGSNIVVNIARKDERVFRALLAISKYAVYGELLMFVGTLGIALSVDLGQQSPNSIIARRMVGDEILAQIYGAQQSNGSNPAPARPVPAGWGPGSPS